MIKDLREAHSFANLKKAWKRITRSHEAYYKGYFRHAVDDNLNDLRSRLLNNTYQPAHAIKIFLPKKSGLQRVYTLLSVEDQIIYQALVNIVAERLAPKMRPRYFKEVFGHVYAGSNSLYFYRDWKIGHEKFSSEIRKVYKQGFNYTASFDLTACYDSIDHSVLGYFLVDLGLKKEFTDKLTNYLRHWTADTGTAQIYQGHGIPQGPISSGLLAEVVLRYFDENRSTKPRAWRYFRYVDDIRFFAKNESDLRSMLLEMDMLSKQIGLFPQSGKIDIHKVSNIEEEIKSLTYPPEVVVNKKKINKKKVEKRLFELTSKYEIKNETRFKFVLGSAEPSSKLSSRLLILAQKYPHLYFSIFNYFDGYQQFPKKLTENFLRLLKENPLYPAFTAYGLKALDQRFHGDLWPKIEQYLAGLIKDSDANVEVRAAAIAILVKKGCLSWQEINANLMNNHYGWWYRAEVFKQLDISKYGQPSYEDISNRLLRDRSLDVSLVAVDAIGKNSLNVTERIDKINETAQISLKVLRLIGKRRGSNSLVADVMKELFGNSMSIIDWKQVFGRHYKGNLSKFIQLRAYGNTDATAWVNLLDSFHDDILDSLFAHEGGAIGNYQHGNIGGIFTKGNSFNKKYPHTFRAFYKVHEMRLESALSHSRVKRSGKRTRFISHDFISEISPQLEMAYREIWRKW